MRENKRGREEGGGRGEGWEGWKGERGKGKGKGLLERGTWIK